jgi:hypothetical protein
LILWRDEQWTPKGWLLAVNEANAREKGEAETRPREAHPGREGRKKVLLLLYVEAGALTCPVLARYIQV